MVVSGYDFLKSQSIIQVNQITHCHSNTITSNYNYNNHNYYWYYYNYYYYFQFLHNGPTCPQLFHKLLPKAVVKEFVQQIVYRHAASRD